MIFYLWFKCFHSTFREYLKVLEVMNKEQWWFKVALCLFTEFWRFANSVEHSWLVIIYCCRCEIMRFCWFFRKFEVLKKLLHILIDIRFFTYYSTLLFKGIHIDSLNICGLLLDKKRKMEILDKYKKTLVTKWVCILKGNCIYIL